eukprot:2312324-Rhodomonas_salina.1
MHSTAESVPVTPAGSDLLLQLRVTTECTIPSSSRRVPVLRPAAHSCLRKEGAAAGGVRVEE